jgi:hypothetical protein
MNKIKDQVSLFFNKSKVKGLAVQEAQSMAKMNIVPAIGKIAVASNSTYYTQFLIPFYIENGPLNHQ